MIKPRTLITAAILVLMLVAAPTFCEESETAVAASKTSESSAPYVVILRDGRSVPARTKPISAFGKFRYVDANGRTQVLSLSKVNVERTRALNSKVSAEGRGGTLSISGGVTTAAAKADQPRGGPSPGQPEASTQKSQPKITVYSATWCGYCTKLKSFLRTEGIKATIIEVDTLPAAKQQQHTNEMKRRTGRVAYPTIVIGQKSRAGFSPQWILAQLGR